jgi:hypothetical protein
MEDYDEDEVATVFVATYDANGHLYECQYITLEYLRKATYNQIPNHYTTVQDMSILKH